MKGFDAVTYLGHDHDLIAGELQFLDSFTQDDLRKAIGIHLTISVSRTR